MLQQRTNLTTLVKVLKSEIQCNPFISDTLLYHGFGYNMVMLWLPNFYHGILQKNCRKMIIKWSFSYNSFVKLSLYNMVNL